MCKEQRPLSIVRFPGDSLNLNPTTSTPLPDANQPSNERTPEEISIFHNIYLPILTRNGIPVTDQDMEEMRLRSLPPIAEDNLAWARRMQELRSYQQLRATQPAPRTGQRPLDASRQFEEPEENVSDPGLPTENRGNASFDLPTFESVLPILQPETWSPITHNEDDMPSFEHIESIAPNQLPELDDTAETVSNNDDDDDDVDVDISNFGDVFWDTVQTVSRDDPRFGDEGYQSLRSNNSGSEREEGEVMECDEGVDIEME